MEPSLGAQNLSHRPQLALEGRQGRQGPGPEATSPRRPILVTTPSHSPVASDQLFRTAAEHVVDLVPVTAPETSIGAVRRSLLDQAFDMASSIAVCQDESLVGLLRIEDALAGREDATAAELMDTDPPVVAPATDQEAAAWRAVHHDESTLAVVDDDGRFVGFIPPDRLLAVLLAEHDEDMARIGGFLRGASSAQTASREPVVRRFWHRLPWLMLGLAGAFAAADIVSAFQTQLEDNVIIAFFIPGIVYMAGAVGAQTTTLIVRGLSVGVPIREVVRRELITGLLVGIAVALAFVPVAVWRWDDSDVVIAVALALFAACSTASIVAMALPWALNRLGKDPAFGSGPLATVIQDLLSVVIYFLIAIKVVQ